MKETKDTKTLNAYSPSIFIIIGASFNILFASLFSILLVTVVITIPTIVFNALLFVPRVNTKRYWAVWKIVPIVLSFFLAFIIFAGILIGAEWIINIIEQIFEFVDKFILFWHDYFEPEFISSSEKLELIKIIFNSLFLFIALTGNVLILLGWYKAKPIGEVQKIDKKKGTK